MASNNEAKIDDLRDAILKYGELNPECVRRYTQGERVIKQGEISKFCFLIKSGTLSILVKDRSAGSETEVALRYPHEFIGETAFLQRGVPRTASVVVFSREAELVSITRSDLYELLAQAPNLHETIASLWELSASRRRETSAVLGGKISVRTKIMSAILADIHNFSSLGELVWEEELDTFLFNFIELSIEIADRHAGMFENQGDGFKILFGGSDHASCAVSCALEILEVFRELRAAKAATHTPFRKIGLGIGVCTDFMSIRRRVGSLHTDGHVMSHALNVAAAIAKYREAVYETEVYVDETTMKLVREPKISFKGAEEILLEKLGRRQKIYRAFRPQSLSYQSKKAKPPQPLLVGRAFISYSHTDVEFVDRLVFQLEEDGITIWRDSTHILVGDDIDQAISEGIQENELFLIVLTPSSVKSDWVTREFDEASHEAISGRKVLLPILACGLRTQDLPPRIRRRKSVVFGDNFERSYSILLESIKKHARRAMTELKEKQ